MRGKNSGSVHEEICGLKEMFNTLLLCVHWSKFNEWNTHDFCVICIQQREKAIRFDCPKDTNGL